MLEALLFHTVHHYDYFREEWEWLTSLIQERTPRCFNDPNSDEFESVDEGDAGCRISSDERCLTNRRATRLSCPTEAQLHFGRQLLLAAKHLFSMLKVSKEEALHHRIHDIEIIELSSDISFILVLPSMENVCSVPGHSDEFSSQHGLVALPVQIFEMSMQVLLNFSMFRNIVVITDQRRYHDSSYILIVIIITIWYISVHMNTYQRDFINRYSRLSSILEMDTIMAQHAHREVLCVTIIHKIISLKTLLVSLTCDMYFCI